MSNGHVCCILGVCCPPGARAAALAELMRRAELAYLASNAAPWSDLDRATWLVDNFGFVPKGLDTAIAEAYAPEFAKLHAKNSTT